MSKWYYIQMRKVPLIEGEYYHIFNRGTDKRNIFNSKHDLVRFLQSMREFNTLKPIGSIYENLFRKNNKPEDPLVEIIAYCLNPNHYHLILKQVSENGISKFMQKIGNGYTKYFNEKHKRSGVLFQGKFKCVHIESNEQLLHVSAYVNLNYLVHKIKLGHPMSKSSWDEYSGGSKENICKKDIILDQFKNRNNYVKIAQETVNEIRDKREMADLLLE